MAFDSRFTSQYIRCIVLGWLFLISPAAAGLAISFCSPDLSTSNFQAVYNTWQTNGACQVTCQGSYAYAVLKGPNCWCSNYAPADQVSTYSCSTPCPGFPSEWCGNESDGLYGYFQLDGIAPSGTAGGSSPTSGSSVSNTPSRPGFSIATMSTPPFFGGSSSLTVYATVQNSIRTSISTVESTSTVPVIVSASVKSSTSASSRTTTRSTTASPTEVYTSITTVTGQVRTVVITPTPSSDSTLGSGNQINSNGGGVSTGKVVGIVVGVALGIGALIGMGVWFYFRRRHQRITEDASIDGSTTLGGNTGVPSRQVSQMSSAGLLGKAPRIHTLGLPSGNNPRSAETLGSNFDRRSVGTDQRLNPYAIYAHDESRHSNVSLQDNQDYSRQLRVANPDP